MKYVGIYSQKVSNNMKSMLLLILFPTIILVLLYAFYAIMGWLSARNAYYPEPIDWDWVNTEFLGTLPWAVGIVGVWFVIASSLLRMCEVTALMLRITMSTSGNTAVLTRCST